MANVKISDIAGGTPAVTDLIEAETSGGVSLKLTITELRELLQENFIKTGQANSVLVGSGATVSNIELLRLGITVPSQVSAVLLLAMAAQQLVIFVSDKIRSAREMVLLLGHLLKTIKMRISP